MNSAADAARRRANRSMTDATTRAFRAVVNCIRANGGASSLSAAPVALIRAGLVVKTRDGVRGGSRAGGKRAFYDLTDAGRALAAEMFPE